MTPKTDIRPAINNTLAILQGKESLSSLIDELDSMMYEEVYNIADELNNNDYSAILQNGQYVAVKHTTKWTRRVR